MGNVEKGKGLSTGGLVGSNNSDHVSSLGCKGSSREGDGAFVNGGEPGMKRDGVRANCPLT